MPPRAALLLLPALLTCSCDSGVAGPGGPGGSHGDDDDFEGWSGTAEHASSYYPQLFMHTAFNPPEYWLRVDGRHDTAEHARIEGAVDGQTITVTTDNVRELAVLLAPELVDIDQPVTIEVDGETLFSGPVEADPRTALTSARERSERSMVFAVEIAGEVPTGG